MDPFLLMAGGMLGGALAWRWVHHRRHRARIRRLLRSDALASPTRRAAAIRRLEREIQSLVPPQQARLVLAQLLIADDRPHEALAQLELIQLSELDEAWGEELRRLACEAELALRNPEGAAMWLARCEGDVGDLRAQVALLRGRYEEALQLLENARPLTRARVLAAAGHPHRAVEILRTLPRAELEAIQRRYSTEAVAALALQLISGPYR